MENKNVIIAILIIIIVILAVAIGVMFMPSLNAKHDCKIAITSNKTLYEGDDVTVKLVDLNKTPIKNGIVDITVTDKNGEVVIKESVTTNSKGRANFEMNLGAGKYIVNATFNGNDNFTGNSTSKKITIEEVVVEEEVSQESSSDSQSSQQSSEYGSYINDEWVSMSESEYAERYPALYHIQTLDEGRYDQYHPEMYEADRENGRI